MRSSPHHGREFDVLDFLSLLSSTGLAAVWLWLVGRPSEHLYFVSAGTAILRLYFNGLPTAAMVADPFLTVWTVAWYMLRLRGTRQCWRNLIRRPGAAVGFVALLAWLTGALVTLRWAMDVHHSTPDWIDIGIIQLASSTMIGGFGIVVTWTGAALNGRWWLEHSWIDRAGLALGIGWIAFGVPSSILLNRLTEPYF